jgi:hypothetical protein
MYTIVNLTNNECLTQRGQLSKVFFSLDRVDFPDASNSTVHACLPGKQIGTLIVMPVQISEVGDPTGTIITDSDPVYSGGDHATVTRTYAVDEAALARSNHLAALRRQADELEAAGDELGALKLRLKALES